MHYLLLFALLALSTVAIAQDAKAPVPVEPPTLCELMVQSLDRCIKGRKSHTQCMIDLRNTLMQGVPVKK